MNCPNCSIPLRLAERQGIEIDYCPECRGVWLDRGELDKLIERAPGASQAMPREVESYRPEWDGQEGRKKKRRSVLGDLFDF
ncbi:MAG TPA: zf-TFIIB domain-containing protein [Fimbriimonadaceae bacterium]|nr:zf-TFIIB domain-containing protein [Fimbriimonadaceae bacterium]HRJ96990.1 zf-TFIIB domain-containing protein [Fimbriimonadaceae bacterium]